MDIDGLVSQLISDEVSEDQQYRIIKQIDHELYEEQTLFALARAFLDYSVKVDNPFVETMDIVGTGGDGCKTLNYSTLSALMVHSMGAKVAKHGNRSATSRCGSFDFLQKLSINIPETPESALTILKSVGLVFLFAPFFHPIFAKVVNVRQRFAKEGKRTFFNVLGPLLNPMQVKRIVAGVYDERLLKPYLYALRGLGVTHAYIVYGGGMDEFSVCGANQIIKLHQDEVREFSLHPEQLGFMRGKLDYLVAGGLYQNLEESRALLNNEMLGAKQDTLILNAAAALHVSQAFAGDLIDQITVIKEALQQGRFSHLLM